MKLISTIEAAQNRRLAQRSMGALSSMRNKNRLRSVEYSRGKLHEVRDTQKVNRNDSCPCGSGKKYKQCCI